jgi:gamma-glutamyl:cysteine ligase YbdK (ATP-grasp superfamily)
VLKVTGDGLVHTEYIVEASYRGVLYGMELEYFTVDQTSLLPKDCLDVVAGHPGFGTLVQPELSSQQVEIKNLPTASLVETEEMLLDICADLVSLLHRADAYPLPVALYDAGGFTISSTPRYQLLSSVLGDAFREHGVTIAADQVNIGAGNEAQAFRIYAAILHFLPEFLRFSAASPFRHGRPNQTKNNRIDAYDASLAGFPGATGFPPAMACLEDYARNLQAQKLFQHPTTAFKYARPMPQRGVAVEIRCIDKQPTIRDSLAFLAMSKAIVNLVESEASANVPAPSPSPEMDNDAQDNDAPDDPALRFRAARRTGFTDLPEHRRMLDYLAGFLEEREREYFQTLYTRLEQGSLADQMVRTAQRHGMDTMYRRIAERFVAPFR